MVLQNEAKINPILLIQDLSKAYRNEFVILNKKIGKKVVGAYKVSFQ